MTWSSVRAMLFSENNTPKTLYFSALAIHVFVFALLLTLYGPYSFFLSDGTLNGNDTQNYVTIAKNIVEGHGYSRFPDAPFELDGFRTPLLPLYFVPFVAMGGLQAIWVAIVLLQILLSLAPVILYKLARLFLNHAVSLVAGLGLVGEPLFIYRSQIAEPDGILVLLLVSALYFLARSWKLGSRQDLYLTAIVLGVAILAKPTALYLAVIIFIFHGIYLIFFNNNSAVQKICVFLIGVLITFSIVFPWVLRNKVLFEEWAVSSVTGYNLYEYYTNTIRLPNEHVPTEISQGSREPSRYLPFQNYFTKVAMMRIKQSPQSYAREQSVGMLRNLFVSDIPAIYYYRHTRILPFTYNPESASNLGALVSRGAVLGIFTALLSFTFLPKIVWMAFLGLLYIFAFVGWFSAWKKDRVFFLLSCLILVLFGYLIAGSGPFVDAKYRLPALPLVTIVALYGIVSLARERQLVRFLRK